eukprot:1816480-Ditylum_brightwellii.AAC.2
MEVKLLDSMTDHEPTCVLTPIPEPTFADCMDALNKHFTSLQESFVQTQQQKVQNDCKIAEFLADTHKKTKEHSDFLIQICPEVAPQSTTIQQLQDQIMTTPEQLYTLTSNNTANQKDVDQQGKSITSLIQQIKIKTALSPSSTISPRRLTYTSIQWSNLQSN